MILTAFKHHKNQLLGKDVADHLLHVLKFWAHADTYRWGYSAEPVKKFEKQPTPKTPAPPARSTESQLEPIELGIQSIKKKNQQQPYLLCLQDPCDYTNDLGKATYSIKHIQATFHQLHKELSARLNSTAEPEDGSYLAPLLKANYEDLEQRRTRLKASTLPRAKHGKVFRYVDTDKFHFYPLTSLLQDQLERKREMDGKEMGREEKEDEVRRRSRLIAKYQGGPGSNR